MKKTNSIARLAFTMVELIFVIVIIGILSAVALPKFRGISNNAKISAEMGTMSSVITALEAVNGEWSINEGSFTWGISKTRTDSNLSATGYPKDLNSSTQTFGEIIKINSKKYKTKYSDSNITIFTGPASDSVNGVSSINEKAGKPDKNDFWVYAFNIQHNMTCKGKTLYPGDFVLIDNNGTNQNYTCAP